MNNEEITTLFKMAASFAERTYKELFRFKPDKNPEAKRELLDALQQAWLTGYAYIRKDPELVISIVEEFGFFVDTMECE